MKLTFVFMLVFLTLYCLHAREISIDIRDSDLDLSLEGATVTSPDGTQVLSDAQGMAIVIANEERAQVFVITYPGYSSLRIICRPNDTTLQARMRLAGVLENQELVIEARRQGKSDAVLGQSQVLTRDTIQQSAKIGLIEDVMTAIKMLPGVGFAGGWNALPSIRGGAPGDLTAALDGFYIEDPYHWGGAFSIFSPNMTQSAKLSHGIFSTRHGDASSGLLEVSSLDLALDHVRFTTDFTTSAFEFSFLVPYQKKGGFLLGGKVTYWDPFVALAGLIVPDIAISVSTAPFIRNAFLKNSLQLGDNVEWQLNGFIASDGVGSKAVISNEEKTVKNDINFDWLNVIGFAYTGLKLTPDPRLLIRLTLGLGGKHSNLATQSLLNGEFVYSDRFLDDWDMIDGVADRLIDGQTGYSISSRSGDFESIRGQLNYQGRLDFDVDIGSKFFLALGATENVTLPSSKFNGSSWQYFIDQFDPFTGKPYAQVSERVFDSDTQGNTFFATGAYSLLSYGTADDAVRFELGVRLDHYYILGPPDSDFELDTKIAANPRFSLTFDLFDDSAKQDRLAATIGSGLFSRPTSQKNLLDKSFNIQSGQLGPDRTWTSVAGIELLLGGEYKFQIEGYFKYGFERFYFEQIYSASTLSIQPHFDGESIIWGIDLLAQRLESRYLDGWISYSFNWTRYRDPQHQAANGSQYGAGSGDWYWPDFHRFHSANLFLNWKPVDGFSLITKLSFGSGTPQQQTGSVNAMAARRQDGVIEEFYTRTQEYSDSLRTELSIPLDLKFTWHWYDKDSKVRSEFYFGAENVLTNLYEPKGATAYDSATGEEYPGTVSFSVGIPLFSIGFNWSY